MAVLSAHMTTLQAVNQMLRSIGETPVSSLATGQPDSAQAEQVLEEVSRRIQAQGWHCNTRRSVSLGKNSSNQFAVGINVLSIDSVNPDSPRRTSTPNPSSYFNVGLRRAADDSKYLLYDVDNDTEVWTDPETMTVDMIEYLPFETLTPMLQIYIYKSAAHEYQKSAVSSQTLYQFTLEDVQEAQINAIQEDTANEDRNIFRNSRAAREVTYRYNPIYNT